MGEGQHRVVVWSTGGIGSIAIRAIHQRPNLDLVGVWVHSEDKVGKDAGELANGEPIGLATTNDADALIALKPDCVVYAASGPERDALAIPDYVKLLSAGINVVTTSTTRLVNPHAYEPAEWRDQLVAAAKDGQVSLYASGIEPGFAADYLPLVLSTQSSQIEKIHSYEIGLYDDYGVPDIMDPSRLVWPTVATAFAGTTVSGLSDTSTSMCQPCNLILPTLPTTTSSIRTGEFDSSVPTFASST